MSSQQVTKTQPQPKHRETLEQIAQRYADGWQPLLVGWVKPTQADENQND